MSLLVGRIKLMLLINVHAKMALNNLVMIAVAQLVKASNLMELVLPAALSTPFQIVKIFANALMATQKSLRKIPAVVTQIFS